MLMNQQEYLDVIASIKSEIRNAQYRATISANRELLLLYYHIGKVINTHKVWGNIHRESFPKSANRVS